MQHLILLSFLAIVSAEVQESVAKKSPDPEWLIMSIGADMEGAAALGVCFPASSPALPGAQSGTEVYISSSSTEITTKIVAFASMDCTGSPIVENMNVYPMSFTYYNNPGQIVTSSYYPGTFSYYRGKLENRDIYKKYSGNMLTYYSTSTCIQSKPIMYFYLVSGACIDKAATSVANTYEFFCDAAAGVQNYVLWVGDTCKNRGAVYATGMNSRLSSNCVKGDYATSGHFGVDYYYSPFAAIINSLIQTIPGGGVPFGIYKYASLEGYQMSRCVGKDANGGMGGKVGRGGKDLLEAETAGAATHGKEAPKRLLR